MQYLASVIHDGHDLATQGSTACHPKIEVRPFL